MTRRRGTASLVASPVLVGAVTVLISIIAVFIAYNANAGLPFVPTYDLKAQIPTGAKLVKGNEVRAGGFRVGVVDEIKPRSVIHEGERKTVAEISLKLDKTVEPLKADTKLEVRPRSALGLKYVEIAPGKGRENCGNKEGCNFAPGDTIPLRNADEKLELEDVFATFDARTRRNIQTATEGFGDAFAGRGPSINAAIEALNPFFKNLVPVAKNLSSRETRLDQFFLQLGRASAQVAPVADVQAQLFTNMADTFEAISRDPVALQLTIEKSPPTMDTAISSFRVQRPFLANFADLSRRLRPAVNQLPRSLPAINTALRVGTPILPRTVDFNRRLRRVLVELEDLFENPSTLLTIRDIKTAFRVSRPALEFIAPYQTVCNYAVYFLHPLGEHQSGTVNALPGGTVQNQGLKFGNPEQENSLQSTDASRPADVPPGVDPIGATNPAGALGRLYAQPYQPAVDAQGNADCQNGQNGWVRGPLAPFARYGPGVTPEGIPTGGNSAVTIDNFPILSGGTYKSRELGIDNLEDVP